MNYRKPPGKQKRVFGWNKNFLILYFLILLFLAIAITSLLKTNWPLIFTGWIFKIDILNFAQSITVLISLASIYFVLEGLELNFRPLISYNSKVFEEKNTGRKIWQVSIKNRGKGSAIIEEVEFEFIPNLPPDLDESEDANNNQEVITDFTKIIQSLSNFESGKNFNLLNISRGASISNDEELIVFDISADKLDKISRFDLSISFKSFYAY